MAVVPSSAQLGRFIKRRREDLGIDQEVFAARLGWSDGTQSRIERGRRGLRHDGEVMLLARELQITEDELRAAADVGAGGGGDGEDTPTLREILEEVRELRQEIQELREAVGLDREAKDRTAAQDVAAAVRKVGGRSRRAAGGAPSS